MKIGLAVSHPLYSAGLEGSATVGFLAGLTGVSIWLYWLYCVFKFNDAVGRIPGYSHPITPARAVGMHFIPVHNLYWIFKWPTALARFVNWRTQMRIMRDWMAGLLVLAAMLTFRLLDGFLGAMFLFGPGWYICGKLRQSFKAPPVPEPAMASPVTAQVIRL